jgi:CubicO group peptidase (beta-lactamase class C family)
MTSGLAGDDQSLGGDPGALEPVWEALPSQATVEAYERASVAWPRDPQGYHTGFSSLKLPPATWPSSATCTSTRDAGTAARWSQPATWPPRPASTAPRRPDFPAEGYGYQWWVTSQAGHASCLAVGYGGQFIQVVPDLDLVVVITSDVNQPRTNNRARWSRARSSRPSPTDGHQPTVDAG